MTSRSNVKKLLKLSISSVVSSSEIPESTNKITITSWTSSKSTSSAVVNYSIRVKKFLKLFLNGVIRVVLLLPIRNVLESTNLLSTNSLLKMLPTPLNPLLMMLSGDISTESVKSLPTEVLNSIPLKWFPLISLASKILVKDGVT